MKRYYRALTIAGSDSGGGAGIQADLKTFSALGCYGMSVITSLTAQNTVTVKAIYPVPPEFIAEQIDAVISDIGVDVVKIGMLHSSEAIEKVAERLAYHKVQKIVLDTVMVAKSGDKLLKDEAVDTLKKVLIPMASVITPNLPEAKVLLKRNLEQSVTSTGPLEHLSERDFRIEESEMETACLDLAKLGPQAVLLKGGHLSGQRSNDMLYISDEDKIYRFDSERIDTKNLHGTGCTLSSAITAYLAKGAAYKEAVSLAKEYITKCIKVGAKYEIGKGHGPVHHFYEFWE